MSSAGEQGAERAARMNSVYHQLPVSLAAGWANALLTSAVLLPVVPLGRLVLWLAAMSFVNVARYSAFRRFIQTSDDRDHTVWEWLSVAGAATSGLLWGLLGAWMMPVQQPYPTFVAFIVGGMCAGSATFNAPHLRTVLGFILPAALPVSLWFAVQGSRLDAIMAAMVWIFAVSLVLAAVRFGEFFDQNTRTRLDLARRTQALAAANERLVAEMDERQATEAALRHAQKMEAVGNLTAGVAHDINNVLMAISGSTELLKDQIEADTESESLLDSIFVATDRGARLTRHLLAFARKEQLTPEVVDLNAVLRGVAPLLEATLGRTIRVGLRLHDGLWPVYVDRAAMEGAIVNLAINARDAMPKGGTLTLSTGNMAQPPAGTAPESRGPTVTLAVADTGCGMTAEVRERAFDPFFTTKPAGKGSGLGLSQVYGLVKQSGGLARIESDPGAGSVIRLFLPRASRALTEMQAGDGLNMIRGRAETALVTAGATLSGTGALPAGLARGHVVVAEDEQFVADVVVGMLRRAGYRVSCFATGTEAVTCVAGDATTTALLTNVGLPDCRGDEVARRVRGLRPGLPVVFITGYNDVARVSGEHWHLRKPFSEQDLLQTLSRATATVRMQA